jgi:hypothetical protein
LRGGQSTELPQHPDVVAIVSACTAANPAQRPTAAVLATILATLADRLDADPGEAMLDDASSGRLQHEPADTSRVADTHQRFWRRCTDSPNGCRACYVPSNSRPSRRSPRSQP